MKLRTKFTIISVIVIGLALGVGLFVFIQVQELEGQIEENRAASEVMKGLFELNLLASDYSLHPGKRNQEQWQLKHQSIEELLQSDIFGGHLHFLQEHLEEKKVLDNLRKEHVNIQTTFLKLTEESISPELEERLVTELLVKSQTMLSAASRLTEASRIDLAITQQRTTLFVMISIAILAGVILSALVVQAKSILGPILSLQKGAERIGSGDFDYKIDIKHKDEIGNVALSFNEMSEALKKSYSNLKERMKELTLIYETSRIMESNDDLNKALSEVIKVIPTAYQFPELICARITYDDKEYKTENFKKTSWGQSEIIHRHGSGRRHGTLEVYYLEERPFLIEEEKMIKEVVSQIENISERKKVERELRKAAVYIDAMGESLMVLDNQRRVVELNRAGMELLGYTEEEALKLSFENIFPKREHEKYYVLMQKAVEGESVKHLETLVVTKEGREIPVSLSGTVLKGSSGEPTGFVGVFADITELKKNEETLRTAEIAKVKAKQAEAIVIRLRELDKMKSEFLDVASHELRTPLTAIRGNIALIQQYFSEKLEDEQLSEMLADVHKGSVRLIGVVNDFLDVSRLEGKRVEFKKEKFEVANLIQGVVDELETTASQKGIYLRLEKTQDYLPKVVGDQEKARQVIINLVGNAIKFTEKGGVNLGFKREDGWVKISVSDTGIGISAEKQKLLFQKFQQAGEGVLTRDVTRGTGLGLYISKSLAEGMGGKVYLEKSELGKGSTFGFSLPRAETGGGVAS